MGTVRFRRFNIRLLVVLAIIAIMAAAAYGFAASNTVPTSRAGDGSGTISGYKVSNIQYVVDSADPSNIASVNFSLNHPARVVEVQLLSTGDSWHTCAAYAGDTTGQNWTCNDTVSVAAADQLRVLATQ